MKEAFSLVASHFCHELIYIQHVIIFSVLIMRTKHKKQHQKNEFEAFDTFVELLRHIQHIHQNDLEKSFEMNLLFMNTFSNCTDKC